MAVIADMVGLTPAQVHAIITQRLDPSGEEPVAAEPITPSTQE